MKICIKEVHKKILAEIQKHTFLGNDPFNTLSENERADREKEITIKELFYAPRTQHLAVTDCPQPFTASFGAKYNGPSLSV